VRESHVPISDLYNSKGSTRQPNRADPRRPKAPCCNRATHHSEETWLLRRSAARERGLSEPAEGACRRRYGKDTRGVCRVQEDDEGEQAVHLRQVKKQKSGG
jgi:hypothetical protein